MHPFTSLTSVALPLPLKDVDTDLIIPARYLTGIGREGYGKHLFSSLIDQDPDFPLLDPKYKDVKILIAGENFGCGSSREHAVWALMDFGFRVIIAPSFADIFFSNGAKNGLVLVRLPETEIDELISLSQGGDYELTVDLRSQRVTRPDGVNYVFDFDPFRKECILNGYDDLKYILSHKEEIDKYKTASGKRRFYSTKKANWPME